KWTGTASDLLTFLPRPDDDKTRPKDGPRLTGRLKKAAGPLGSLGVNLDFDRTNAVRTATLQYTTPPGDGDSDGDGVRDGDVTVSTDFTVTDNADNTAGQPR